MPTTKRVYRNINHPAVAAVMCPHCYQVKGVPCIRHGRSASDRHFVETHMARVHAAKKQEEHNVQTN